MRYRVNQVKVPLQYDDKKLIKALSKKLSLPPKFFENIEIIKRSVDARKELSYIMSIEFTTQSPLRKKHRDLQIVDKKEFSITTTEKRVSKRPIIIGAGPAGLSAAYILAQSNLKPIVIERGDTVDHRSRKVNRFWQKGELDVESNVLYGEGGAGLFSDGKLTARSKDNRRLMIFLQMLVDFGADKEVLIDTHPHIGTDKLIKILPKIRDEIVRLGGEFHFNEKLEDVTLKDEKVVGITTSKKEYKTDHLVVAIGHSARDTYRMLYSKGIYMEPKPTAIGVRVEVPQSYVNRSQYHCEEPSIGAASFRLTRKDTEGVRACYSFCMCPGGEVISCASSEGMLTSNGMSYHSRKGYNANAAFLVPVSPNDYKIVGSNTALSGVMFQEELEKRVFEAGGKDYSLPATTLYDFLKDTPNPQELPQKYSAKRVNPHNLKELMPDYMYNTLRDAIPDMLKKLGNPDHKEVTIYGLETRSSSPLQIKREKDGVSVSHKGLYPIGEGAGYAGGIVSSGIDGIKVAELIIESI